MFYDVIMLLDTLTADLRKASEIDPDNVSDLLKETGFRCKRCGWCCCPDPEFITDIMGIQRPSNAISVFPGDVRNIVEATGLEWLDVVEPDIYSGIRGVNIWAIGWILTRKADGSCTFFDVESKSCTIYEHRPLICRCYPFFLDSDGRLVVRHCRAARRAIKKDDVEVQSGLLIEYLAAKTRNYIAIAEGLKDVLDLDRLCHIKPEAGLVLYVFDGENMVMKKYSSDDGWSSIN
jgi:Fe-S-cluster containining protein